MTEEENKMKKKKKQKKSHRTDEKQLNENESNNNNNNETPQETEQKKNDKGNTEQQHRHSNKRKRKEVFPFGNYRSYYGYRIGQGMEEDPRLKVLNKDWFQGKDCLDIGCNSGIITIQIAKKFGCRKILGIDVDSDRIADAYWHLRKFVREEGAGKSNSKASRMEVKEKINGSKNSPAPSSVDQEETTSNGLCSPQRDLFDIVSFKKENFVLSSSCLVEQYDTILCLSVSKWIHLNWGDDGLITLFSKAWKLLRPGGILVLEPQPWRSYENNKSVSETTAKNYRTIIFRPQHFNEILLDKIGFRKAEDLSSALSGSKAGFDRPIFAYQK